MSISRAASDFSDAQIGYDQACTRLRQVYGGRSEAGRGSDFSPEEHDRRVTYAEEAVNAAAKKLQISMQVFIAAKD